MNGKNKAVAILVVALVIGAVAQGVVHHEAAILGLSAVELALAGLVVGSAARRTLG
jgi:hypothetical protein